MDTWITNWKHFYTSNGIPGISNPSTVQVDLAARGAAWGDAVGTALANDLGPLGDQAINFLEAAAYGLAVYSASLASQPTDFFSQGSTSLAAGVQIIGIAPNLDLARVRGAGPSLSSAPSATRTAARALARICSCVSRQSMALPTERIVC